MAFATQNFSELHRSCPSLQLQRRQAAIIEGIHEGERDFGVIGRLIPSIDREDTPEAAVQLAQEMIANRAPETIGIALTTAKMTMNRKTSGRLFIWPRKPVLK